MARDWSSVGESFPTTRWTLLDTGPAAVAVFFERYRPALNAHLVQFGRIDPHDTDDLIQSFVTTQMMEQDLLSRAEAGQGRFRTFLLTALNRYVVSEYRRRNAHKAWGGDLIRLPHPFRLQKLLQTRAGWACGLRIHEGEE